MARVPNNNGCGVYAADLSFSQHPSDLSETVQAHVATCARCAGRLQVAHRAWAALRSSLTPKPPDELRELILEAIRMPSNREREIDESDGWLQPPAALRESILAAVAARVQVRSDTDAFPRPMLRADVLDRVREDRATRRPTRLHWARRRSVWASSAALAAAVVLIVVGVRRAGDDAGFGLSGPSSRWPALVHKVREWLGSDSPQDVAWRLAAKSRWWQIRQQQRDAAVEQARLAPPASVAAQYEKALLLDLRMRALVDELAHHQGARDPGVCLGHLDFEPDFTGGTSPAMGLCARGVLAARLETADRARGAYEAALKNCSPSVQDLTGEDLLAALRLLAGAPAAEGLEQFRRCVENH